MREEEYFAIDRAYLAEQAREALRIYFAPVVWLWRAMRKLAGG